MLTQDARWKTSGGRGDKFGKSCWGQVTEGSKGQTNYLDFVHEAILKQKKDLAVVEWVDVSRGRVETD